MYIFTSFYQNTPRLGYGYGAAVAFLLFGLILALTLLQFACSGAGSTTDEAEPSPPYRRSLTHAAADRRGAWLGQLPVSLDARHLAEDAAGDDRFPPTLWPSEPQWGNYPEAWQAAPFGRYFLNSASSPPRSRRA